MQRQFRRALPLAIWFLLLATHALAAPTIRVQLSEQVATQPYSGRVYVFFSQGRPEPRGDHTFGRHEPMIATDVTNLKPGEFVSFSPENAARFLAYPKPFSEMNLAGYKAQAVMRLNPFVPGIGRGAGNGFSTAAGVPAANREITLVVDQVNPPPTFNESEFCKLLAVRSEHLSRFHGRDVTVNGGIVLPPSYFKEPERRYPVIFNIPGFGGTHMGASRRGGPTREPNNKGVEFISVSLDGSCQRGHHVYADSANNGPYATALVEDFIPELDKKYRTVPYAGARYLTGVSSGGWSSLWLQVTRPDDFGGTWSHAPDPVDFRDFQQINIYRQGENMYVDPAGAPRPLSRGRGGGAGLMFKDFSLAEKVLGYGGQLHSFEAVFSQRDASGEPLYLWNRQTGAIDPAVAKEWEKYDIRLVLERNWKTLGPKLAGKLHIHMGDMDTYYLEGATLLLRDTLKNLGSDAEVVIYPGAGHGTFVRGIRGQLSQLMADTFAKNHPELVPATVGASR
ncbi:MAG: alpha/beta hydrolase-fold protein [Pirellulales bacterium]